MCGISLDVLHYAFKQSFVWAHMTDYYIWYIRAIDHVCGALFWYLAASLHPGPFHGFGISCFVKACNKWLPSIIYTRWLHVKCVTRARVPLWGDVILIWYHYIVICKLVTVSNWWLSSKDMKLQLLIKEAFVVFHLLLFCILDI